MKKINLLLLLSLFTLFLSFSALAASTAHADKLNYHLTAENHTVYITNNEGVPTTYSVAVPAGWTASSGSGCVAAGSEVNCTSVADGTTVNYLLENPIADPKYAITTVSTTGGTTNDVQFIMIANNEIFHTLVEFGRGRGNYFFDSFTENTSGSGKTGIGYPYLPNGSLFELNYLHKILNIKQYFGFADALAENATWSCTYPNNTVVRQHLITNISRGSVWDVAYKVDEIEGSWERMGYLGQDFAAGSLVTGQNVTVNCTDIRYVLQAAGGNISVDEDAFSLEIRERVPFTVGAFTTSTIGNGTQEVIIEYTINNSEVYPADSVMIEIQAPEYATFIGTRGELWGAGRDKFLMERTEVVQGGSEVVTLVARFDTSDTPAITSVDLSQGVKIKYITPWEANAYNPQEYIQDITASAMGTTGVNMSVPTSIISLQDQINNIYSVTIQINNTVTTIEEVVTFLNNSVWNQTTAQDILDAISNINTTSETNNTEILSEINSTRDSILSRIRQLGEFDEELVFLVTDSFGLQDDARQEILEGDREGAMNSLRDANQRLREAAERLEQLQSETETEVERAQQQSPSSAAAIDAFPIWPLIAFLAIIAVLLVYLHFHRKENEIAASQARKPRKRTVRKKKR